MEILVQFILKKLLQFICKHDIVSLVDVNNFIRSTFIQSRRGNGPMTLRQPPSIDGKVPIPAGGYSGR